MLLPVIKLPALKRTGRSLFCATTLAGPVKKNESKKYKQLFFIYRYAIGSSLKRVMTKNMYKNHDKTRRITVLLPPVLPLWL